LEAHGDLKCHENGTVIPLKKLPEERQSAPKRKKETEEKHEGGDKDRLRILAEKSQSP